MAHKAFWVLWMIKNVRVRGGQQWRGVRVRARAGFLILITEVHQFGFPGAGLVLFTELSFNFWSFTHLWILLTVHNSSAILFIAWETKKAKQGALLFLSAVVSEWNWLGIAQPFSCYTWWNMFSCFGFINICRKKLCMYRVSKECFAKRLKCSIYQIY